MAHSAKFIFYATKNSTHECANCKKITTNLEFAHFKRADKFRKDGKTVRVRDLSYENVEQELSKGRFLCKFCHRDETMEEREENEREFIIYAGKRDTRCPCCKLLLPKKAFTSYAKPCRNCIADRKKRTRKRLQDIVNEIKMKIGFCNFCNMKVVRPYHFDFDHIDPNEKLANVSDLASRGRSVKLIKKEIEKCRLLCCECHQRSGGPAIISSLDIA